MANDWIVASAPLLLLVAGILWGGWMKRRCPFQPSAEPVWPYAENANLALELASSPKHVDQVLGAPDTAEGRNNRASARRLQKLDFVFISLYVLFFAAAGHGAGVTWPRALPVILCAFVTGLFDVLENVAILRLTNSTPRGSVRVYGQLKWFAYFLTVGLEGVLLIFTALPATALSVVKLVVGGLCIAVFAGGAQSSVKGSFNGITTGKNLSALALAALALLPLISRTPVSWLMLAEYGGLMRVPLLTAALLLFLPAISFLTGARSLLRGLFDLTPASTFVVTLAAMALSGTACSTANLVMNHGGARAGISPLPAHFIPSPEIWLVIMLILSLPIVLTAIAFSIREDRGRPSELILAAVGGIAVALALAATVVHSGRTLAALIPGLGSPGFERWLEGTGLFRGYVDPNVGKDPWADHLTAFVALAFALLIYAAVGLYGWRKLGKVKTVPALCSALMMTMVLSWMLSGAAFFFDQWRIPLLLIVLVAGTLTAQSKRSDHFYDLRDIGPQWREAPDAAETLAPMRSKRLIVVAANGGGIQAGAWAARVLFGLLEECGQDFRDSVRMISSVSGGSVGTACYVHWLAEPDDAVIPPVAAAESSLDEVAWGLGWTDLIRALCPWFFGWMVGRGRALEKAWLLNATRKTADPHPLDQPLSTWNERVAKGELPGVILNATVTETGERLLLSTTRLNGKMTGQRARVDAKEVHTVNGVLRDVGIVTAARLSASFPYVTPAARAQAPGPRPHVVDGGYYDNYGMATLVEWLDEALDAKSQDLDGVLVIQIHGAPVKEDPGTEKYKESHGWFYQAIAPLATMAAVRSAGQIAHNDIELSFLQRQWASRGLPVHTVTFEFNGLDAPLSWHLTQSDTKKIEEHWQTGMDECRTQVQSFLQGQSRIGCKCPWCTGAAMALQAAGGK